MKINGKKIDEVHVRFAIIPRHSGDIIFKAQAVLDYDDFEKLCPEPKPPIKTTPGQASVRDVEDTNYKAKLFAYFKNRQNWTIIKSLQSSPGLEWEKIDYSKSETWGEWINELKESKFTISEINLILEAVNQANSLDDGLLTEARNRFLASQQALPVQS